MKKGLRLHNIGEFAIDRELDRNGYISIKNIEELVKYDKSLLWAGAGTGKTTAAINYGLIVSPTRIVLLVPTFPMVKDLENAAAKNGQRELVQFFYDRNEGCVDIYDENKKVTVMTYAQWENYQNKFKDAVLFCDEVHELMGFCGIKGPKGSEKRDENKNKNMALVNASNKKVFITATPFALHVPNYSKIFRYKTDISDKKLVISESAYGCEADAIKRCIIAAAQGKKVLLYYNDSTNGQKCLEKLKTNGISGIFVNSELSKEPAHKTKELQQAALTKYAQVCIFYEAVKQNTPEQRIIELPFEVVAATKLLNIGLNIRNTFDVIIYTNPNSRGIRVCDALQILARDRDAKEIYFCHNKQNHLPYEINTKKSKNRLTDEFTKYEKMQLDDCYYMPSPDEDAVFSDDLYACFVLGRYAASTEEFKRCLDDNYSNYNLDIEYVKEKDPYKRDTLLKKLEENGHDLGELYKLWSGKDNSNIQFKENRKYVYDELSKYSFNHRERIINIFNALKNDAIHHYLLKEGLTNKDFLSLFVKENQRGSGGKLNELLALINSQQKFDVAAVEKMCKELAKMGIKFNGETMKEKNFKKFLESFDIYFEREKLGKKNCLKFNIEYDSAKRFQGVWVNKTLTTHDFIDPHLMTLYRAEKGMQVKRNKRNGGR